MTLTGSPIAFQAIRGQRSLLRQIREALAGAGGPAQARLDMVVRIIARSMVAEVCSLYMRRAAATWSCSPPRAWTPRPSTSPA
jgi:hypothetical protein